MKKLILPVLLLILLSPMFVYMVYVAVVHGRAFGLAFQMLPVAFVFHGILTDFKRMSLFMFTLISSVSVGLMAAAAWFDASRGTSEPLDWGLWVFALLLITLEMLGQVGVLRRMLDWLESKVRP